MANISTETVLEVDNGDWPIRATTVYDTAAEIKRRLTFNGKTAGTNLLKLRGLPSLINPASVRADIVSKNARLLEVFHDIKYETGKEDEKTTERLKELNREISLLTRSKARLTLRNVKITQHKAAVISSLNGNALNERQAVLEPSVFEKLSDAITFYTKLTTKLAADTEKLDEEIKVLVTERNFLNNKQHLARQTKTIHEVSILIDIPELQVEKGSGTIDIDLLYLVAGASWSAKYDIRVEKDSDEKDTEEKAVLSYFAEVTNGTGENWVEVEMSLSTAKPSVGGALPTLPRRQVDYEEAILAVQTTNYGGHTNAWNRKPQRRRLSLSLAPQMMSNVAKFDDVAGLSGLPAEFEALLQQQEQPQMQMSAVAAGDAGSTLFKIQRLANIDSDYTPHKQTIGLIPLPALYTYAVSPKLTTNVYIKCQTRNDSEYPFLPGPLRVFIDGSFVSNSTLRLVRPKEEFSLFLGIDDSIKCVHGPEQVNKKTVGNALGKKRWYKLTSREVTIINNSAKDINCCIYNQLPESKDGKVKVDLKKPDLKAKGKAKHEVNPFSHVESRMKVKAGKNFKMEFAFTLEWPENEELEFNFVKSKS